jgi:LmbE family N-acetylglucosaminyl deacetylase
MSTTSRKHDLFIPDGLAEERAIGRTTHLGIGAHQDDLEFMAFHGIAECFYSTEKWFGGITCTDGAGSSHAGPYAGVSSSDLSAIRMQEQRTAALAGRYSFMAQLGYPSKDITQPIGGPLVSDLLLLFGRMKPSVIYTHNPADKHETHLRVLVAVLEALREVAPAHRPAKLLGCEMWRSLDWMQDGDKVVQDLGGHGQLASALNGLFDSQIAGGKRYDLAVAGRRRANATLLDSHSGDALTEAAFVMDLSPLIGAASSDLVDFTLAYVDRFRDDIRTKLERTRTK